MIDLLAGAANPTDFDSHTQLVEEMVRILEAQRIVSLNDLFGMADHLDRLAQRREDEHRADQPPGRAHRRDPAAARQLSAIEKNALRSATGPRNTSSRAQAESARASTRRPRPEKLKRHARPAGPLPAGHAGGLTITCTMRRPARRCCTPIRCSFAATIFWAYRAATTCGGPPRCSASGGHPTPAGGWSARWPALPYALAEAEQNFLIPAQTQALIWGDLVPQMMLTAVIPRWWNVTPAQLHWVGAAHALRRVTAGRSGA